MKNILIALALALGCVTVQAAPVAPATVNVDGTAIPLRITSTLAEDVLDAEKAVERARLDFIPDAGETFHFDANGQKSAKPVKGGFFRKVVGTTADGRIVVQDFWQDSGKAQTEPYAVAKEAAVDAYGIVKDSTLVLHDPGDAIIVIVPYHAGKVAGRIGFYKAGRLRTQYPLQGADTENGLPELRAFATTHARVFYPDGKLMALVPFDAKNFNTEGVAIMYRADGTLLANEASARKEWVLYDATGKALTKGTPAHSAAEAELKNAGRQLLALDKWLEQISLEINHGGDKNRQD